MNLHFRLIPGDIMGYGHFVDLTTGMKFPCRWTVKWRADPFTGLNTIDIDLETVETEGVYDGEVVLRDEEVSVRSSSSAPSSFREVCETPRPQLQARGDTKGKSPGS